MNVVDAQIHVWEENRPGRRWDREFAQSRRWFLDHAEAITIDRAIASMDAVGVDAAVVTSFLVYHDVDYTVRAAIRYPDRFRIVTQLDLGREHPEEQVEEFRSLPGLIAVRVSLLFEQERYHARLRAGGYDPVFVTARKHDLPVMLLMPGRLGDAGAIARAHPDVQFVIDHVGMAQGRTPDDIPEDPFGTLPDLLALGKLPNVAVKLTGAPTLSHEPYPYNDLWPPLHRIIDAFGPERLMWGSDFGRARAVLNYSDGLTYLKHSAELSLDEKELLLGGSLRRLLNWPIESDDER